ncbi:MAG: discoidin domain-containing protein, partial [Pirellulales bacterium]
MRATLQGLALAAVLGLSCSAAAWGATLAEQGGTEAAQPVRDRAQIEADWLCQDVVRNLPPGHNLPAVRPEEDAPSACDGVRNGKYGFHTDRQERPWWQVDLRKSLPIEEVLIYNRCDGSSERAFRLQLLLSDDGKTWNTVYQHDGTPFLGHSDNKPLSIRLAETKARFLRIQLPGSTWLHLDEVEIYQPGGRRNIALRKPATQSSVSPWSTRSSMVSVADETALRPATRHGEQGTPEPAYPIRAVVRRG